MIIERTWRVYTGGNREPLTVQAPTMWEAVEIALEGWVNAWPSELKIEYVSLQPPVDEPEPARKPRWKIFG